MLIEARVSLRYGGQVVLRDLEMGIAAGATVGLAGESGSGKSSLGQILLGLLRAPAVVVPATVGAGARAVGQALPPSASVRPWLRV